MEVTGLIVGIIASIVTIIGIPLLWKQLSDLLPPKQIKIKCVEYEIINKNKIKITANIIVDDIDKLIINLVNDINKTDNIKIIMKRYQKYSSRKRQYKYDSNKKFFDAIILKPSIYRTERIIIRGLKLIFDKEMINCRWNDNEILKDVKKFVLDYFDLFIEYFYSHKTEHETLDFYFYNNDKTFYPTVKVALDEKTKSKFLTYFNASKIIDLISFPFYMHDGSDFIKIAPDYKRKIILRLLLDCANNDNYWDNNNRFKFENDIVYIFTPYVWRFGLS